MIETGNFLFHHGGCLFPPQAVLRHFSVWHSKNHILVINWCFVSQGAWRMNGARWSPVWTVCPASWSGSPPTAAVCRSPTAPGPCQRTRPARQRPRGPSRSPPRPPARTPTWSIKSYRPSHPGLYHPVIQHRPTHEMYGSSFLPEKLFNVK